MEQTLNRLDIMNVELPEDLEMASDEDADDETFTTAELLNANLHNNISNSLAEVGTIPSLAAAAALVTSKKKHQPYNFEINPAVRKRQHTRLVRKLKQTIHELCTRCGQQAIVLCVSPGKENPSFRVFGSSPLDQVVKNCQALIFQDLERQLQEKLPSRQENNTEHQYELPPLMVDGIPTPLEKMNQAQLRMFIPEMLRYSTGRGKPGWGKDSTRPVWWPLDVPWSNVRRDDRSEDVKVTVSWTQALRQIVKNCYRYHSREDLLNGMSCDTSVRHSTTNNREKYSRLYAPSVSVTPPTLVQTVHNADGSVSLVQLDSGQTIATITQDQTGAAVATLTNPPSDEPQIEMGIEEIESSGWPLAAQEATMSDPLASMSANSQQDRKQPNDVRVSFAGAEQILDTASLGSAGDVTISADDDESAMVQIPVSVYERIASSIQQSGAAATVSISADGRIHLQPTSTVGMKTPERGVVQTERSKSNSVQIELHAKSSSPS